MIGAMPESWGERARAVTARPIPVPAMIAKMMARGFGSSIFSPVFELLGTKPTSTTAIRAMAIASQPKIEKLSPNSETPITAGTIAESKAPSGETIEIGPSASEAYRASRATTELKPPMRPQKKASLLKVAPSSGESKSSTTRPVMLASAVTTTTRIFLEAIAAKKSAAP